MSVGHWLIVPVMVLLISGSGRIRKMGVGPGRPAIGFRQGVRGDDAQAQGGAEEAAGGTGKALTGRAGAG